MRGLTVYLVRHGESVSNGLNKIQGHSDSGLTERGLRQAEKVGRRLYGAGITRIYSSDLGRAQTTASKISAVLGLPIETEQGLREIRLGEWEGMSVYEVNEKYNRGYDRWLNSPTKMLIPGAETVAEFLARTRGTLDKIMSENRRGPVAVVTHGGVIASLLSGWLGADFDLTLLNLRVDNTSVTVVEKNIKRVKIHALNDTRHLSSADLSTRNIFTNR